MEAKVKMYCRIVNSTNGVEKMYSYVSLVGIVGIENNDFRVQIEKRDFEDCFLRVHKSD
jgi:hypothetical protein